MFEGSLLEYYLNCVIHILPYYILYDNRMLSLTRKKRVYLSGGVVVVNADNLLFAVETLG